MDINCPSCGEPWDSYHLRHDAIWETDLPENLIKDYSDQGTPLNAITKPALERDGWKFAGNSVLTFTRCPCCEADDAASDDDIAKREVLADMLGDDEDAIQSMLEDGI